MTKRAWLDALNAMLRCRQFGHRWGKDEPFCLRCGTRKRRTDQEPTR